MICWEGLVLLTITRVFGLNGSARQSKAPSPIPHSLKSCGITHYPKSNMSCLFCFSSDKLSPEERRGKYGDLWWAAAATVEACRHIPYCFIRLIHAPSHLSSLLFLPSTGDSMRTMSKSSRSTYVERHVVSPAVGWGPWYACPALSTNYDTWHWTTSSQEAGGTITVAVRECLGDVAASSQVKWVKRAVLRPACAWRGFAVQEWPWAPPRAWLCSVTILGWMRMMYVSSGAIIVSKFVPVSHHVLIFVLTVRGMMPVWPLLTLWRILSSAVWVGVWLHEFIMKYRNVRRRLLSVMPWSVKLCWNLNMRGMLCRATSGTSMPSYAGASHHSPEFWWVFIQSILDSTLGLESILRIIHLATLL